MAPSLIPNVDKVNPVDGAGVRVASLVRNSYSGAAQFAPGKGHIPSCGRCHQLTVDIGIDHRTVVQPFQGHVHTIEQRFLRRCPPSTVADSVTKLTVDTALVERKYTPPSAMATSMAVSVVH